MLGRVWSKCGTLLVKYWEVVGQILGSSLFNCGAFVCQKVGPILARCGDHFAVLGVLTVDPGARASTDKTRQSDN